MKKRPRGSKKTPVRKAPAKRTTAKRSAAPSAAAGDWRADMLARLRAIVRQADPAAVEEVKWKKPSNPAGVPVWSHNGILCTGEIYKDVVKMTFAKGASLPDPAGIFNASLDGNVRRAIDFREGDKIDAKSLRALVRAAAALNASGRSGGGA